jgi:hypothetical protein
MAKDQTGKATGPRAGRSSGSRGRRNQPGRVADEPLELVPPTVCATAKERWLPVVVIALLAFVAYIPSLNNGFVSWDDDHYIYKNHQIHYDDGIKSIWFDVFKHKDDKFRGDGRSEDRVSHQYYPMVFTVYWLEFRVYKWFFGADPNYTIEENVEKGLMSAHGFHLVSVLMHMINVMLLIFCFRQLGISNWVAWAATILFALHPMHASSVAWAAERKNIISLMFYLLSMMSYIKMRRDGNWWRYVLAIVLYQAALFSKTVSLTLPVMLFFTDRLLEGRWKLKPFLMQLAIVIAQAAVWIVTWRMSIAFCRWRGAEIEGNLWIHLFPMFVVITLSLLVLTLDRDRLDPDFTRALKGIVRILPFVVLSIVAAWTTIQVEDRQRTIPITDTQRPLLPAAILLWYPFKMLFPLDQTPVYSLWPVDATEFLWFMPTLAVLAAALVLTVLGVLSLMGRRLVSPVFIWALIFYCVTQGPMLGLKNINYFQFAYVADHYFYHGAVGLMLMLAIGADLLRRKLGAQRGRFVTVGVCALALGWGARTFFYVEHWENAETFWARVLDKTPDCWPGWYNTANARKRQAIDLQARIRLAKLDEDARAKLRKEADELQAKIEDPDLDERKRRRLRLRRDAKLERAEWPDLTPEQLAEKRKQRDELFEEAVRRYEKVADIHQQITQPFDQWISVRVAQGDWAKAYEAAYAAARRFPTYVDARKQCYYDQAGLFAQKAKMYAESADCYERAAQIYQARKLSAKANQAYGNAGLQYRAAGDAAKAIEQFIVAGNLSEARAKGLAAQNNPCEASRIYKLAATYYAEAYRTDPQRKDLQRKSIDLNKQHLTAKEMCP